MNECLDCLTVSAVPSMGKAERCGLKHRKAGFKALFAVYCGLKFQVDDPAQDAIAAFLSGSAMPLNLNARAIAAAHQDPPADPASVEANAVEAAQWALLGYFGDSMRGSMQRQDAITHIGGSCEMPSLANNSWRANFMFTKTGGANGGDYAMVEKILKNQKAYHLIAVECFEKGETPSAVVFEAGEYVFSEYNFNRSDDGVKDFVTRNFSVDLVQLLEPKSYPFPIYSEVMGVFQ